MRKIRFLHIADVHLGMQPDKNFPWSDVRKSEIWDSFKNIIDIAADEKPELLLIAGDLFHKQPLIRELKEVDSLFVRIPDTKVLIIAGNHDYISGASNYNGFEWSENVTFFKNEAVERVYFKDLETAVYGISFCHREINDYLLKGVAPEGEEAVSILLMHGGIAGCLPIDTKELGGAGFNYVACGHIHVPSDLAPDIRYSGDVEPLDRNDLGRRGFIRGEIIISEGTTVTKTEFVPINKRTYFRCDIPIDSGTTELLLKDKISETIRVCGDENLFTFVLKGYRDPDIVFEPEVLLRLGNIVAVEDETVPDYNYERIMQENSGNLLGSFVEKIYEADVSDEVRRKALEYGVASLIRNR